LTVVIPINIGFCTPVLVLQYELIWFKRDA